MDERKTRPLIHSEDGGILEPIGEHTMKCGMCGTTFQIGMEERYDNSCNRCHTVKVRLKDAVGEYNYFCPQCLYDALAEIAEYMLNKPIPVMHTGN